MNSLRKPVIIPSLRAFLLILCLCVTLIVLIPFAIESVSKTPKLETHPCFNSKETITIPVPNWCTLSGMMIELRSYKHNKKEVITQFTENCLKAREVLHTTMAVFITGNSIHCAVPRLDADRIWEKK